MRLIRSGTQFEIHCLRNCDHSRHLLSVNSLPTLLMVIHIQFDASNNISITLHFSFTIVELNRSVIKIVTAIFIERVKIEGSEN